MTKGLDASKRNRTGLTAAALMTFLSFLLFVILSFLILNDPSRGGTVARYLMSLALILFVAGFFLSVFFGAMVYTAMRKGGADSAASENLALRLCTPGRENDAGQLIRQSADRFFLDNTMFSMFVLVPEERQRDLSVLRNSEERLLHAVSISWDGKGEFRSFIANSNAMVFITPSDPVSELSRKLSLVLSITGGYGIASAYYTDRPLKPEYFSQSYSRLLRDAALSSFFSRGKVVRVDLGVSAGGGEVAVAAPFFTEAEEISEELRKDPEGCYERFLALLKEQENDLVNYRTAFSVIKLSLDKLALSLVYDEALNGYCRSSFEDFRSPEEVEDYIRSYIAAIGENLCGSARKRIYSYAEKANSLIYANYRNPHYGIGQIADDMDLNVSYLSRVYKEVTGTTLIETLMAAKLNESVRLLTSTETPVAEVYRLSGYSSNNYFYRVFKRQYLMTPARYRSEFGKGGKNE